MFDLLIKNGTIIDGSGEKEKFPANLAVHKGKIHKIGKLRGAVAKKTIDASGCYVTPGFVDIQNHSDSYWTLFTLPSQDSLIAQGITTILGGNCGSSLAPLVDAENIKTIQKWTPPQQLAINWLTLQEFLKQLKNQGIGVNFASLIGHATLRRGLLRDEVRSITKEEVGQMVEMLKDALKQGGFGLSSGLVYTHAKIAETDELIQLVQQIGSQLYASHIRGEGEELIPAVKETLKIAQKTKAQVEISHLKALGQKNWPKMSRALHLIEEAREKGAQINFDIYPYTFTGSVLYILLPDWVAEGGKVAFLPRLRDPVIRSKVVKEMKEDMDYDFSQVKVKGKTLSGP